jgi:hypothetical protein
MIERLVSLNDDPPKITGIQRVSNEGLHDAHCHVGVTQPLAFLQDFRREARPDFWDIQPAVWRQPVQQDAFKIQNRGLAPRAQITQLNALGFPCWSAY